MISHTDDNSFHYTLRQPFQLLFQPADAATQMLIDDIARLQQAASHELPCRYAIAYY